MVSADPDYRRAGRPSQPGRDRMGEKRALGRIAVRSPSLSAMPFSERRLDFIPERDGFSFPNAFTWTPLDLDFLSRWFRPVSLPVAAALPASGAALAGGWRGLAAGALVGVGLAQAGLGAGLVRGAARRWRSFGLCGGMACVAAQRWPHRGGLPTAELQPNPMR